jgi:hypothetical protein
LRGRAVLACLALQGWAGIAYCGASMGGLHTVQREMADWRNMPIGRRPLDANKKENLRC